jgi:hypothetical protein
MILIRRAAFAQKREAVFRGDKRDAFARRSCPSSAASQQSSRRNAPKDHQIIQAFVLHYLIQINEGFPARSYPIAAVTHPAAAREPRRALRLTAMAIGKVAGMGGERAAG